MDLKEFIKESLVQIAAGVKESQAAVRDACGYVNPAVRVLPKNTDNAHMTYLPDGRNVFLVDFDVAVTVSESEKAKGGAKLQVASFVKLGGNVGGTSSSSATNRLTFKVPLALPADEESLDVLKESDERQKRRIKEQTAKRKSQRNDWQI